MKNYLDLTADNRARRQSEQAFEESHRHNIDTARHAFERLQRTQTQHCFLSLRKDRAQSGACGGRGG